MFGTGWEGSRVVFVTHSLWFLGWSCYLCWSQFAALYLVDSLKPCLFHSVKHAAGFFVSEALYRPSESGLSSSRRGSGRGLVMGWGPWSWAGAVCSPCTDGKLQWEEEATVNRLQSNEVQVSLGCPPSGRGRVGVGKTAGNSQEWPLTRGRDSRSDLFFSGGLVLATRNRFFSRG